MSSAISGVLFATFSGQPLSILGATGPFLAYTLVVYDLAVSFELEFMPFYWWTCMWCALFTVLVAVTDLCALMKHVIQHGLVIVSNLDLFDMINNSFFSSRFMVCYVSVVWASATFKVGGAEVTMFSEARSLVPVKFCGF